mmetsp:Transcript_25379/g.58463  ORF Transcript_25379/g.58463 Transcript_25379/m.58463 type:complete len:1193 (+) Transcript_25379:116-3694(+)
MFIYLNKKIAIPNGIKLRDVAWNSEQGWIACGGENGLLKVLKLDSTGTGKERGVAGASNLSMNQTLEGHSGAVVVVRWNENYRKLTTSDSSGLIIVWNLHKNQWFEEMINNRNKSVVRDMKWTPDGQKICIVYEDGAVIVGSVDGNRLWGEELKLTLSLVEWSPDGRTILFVTTHGEVHCYDSHGNFMMRMPLFSGEDLVPLSGICWYDGLEGMPDPTAPSLALAYENGRVQLMRHEVDEKPILIDTGMFISRVAWNTNGTVMAVAGQQPSRSSGDKEFSMVQFYSPFGIHLRTLRVPGSGIQGLSWEGGGLRIALAVDSFIFFANIRPDYKWGFFGNTLVYAFNKPERPEHCVIFWDSKNDEKYTKYVKKLLAIRAIGEYAVLATRTADTAPQFILILCNAIGSPVDSKHISIEPTYLAMTKTHIIAASDEVVYIWHYSSKASKLTSISTGTEGMVLKRKEGRETVFHIDEPPTPSTGGFDKFQRPASATHDVICAVGANEHVLVVGRESGTVHRYSLPHVALETKYVLRCRPQLLAVNCNSSRMGIIDINGMMSFYDMQARPQGSAPSDVAPGEHLPFERKDAWDIVWAEDNPDLCAMMERSRMYIFRTTHPEEPLQSSGYLCRFSDLQVTAVLLDEVMRNPEHPEKDTVLEFETKSLRDTRKLLVNVGIEDSLSFVEDNPHPRLWRLLAESALERLDFAVAERAFVHCQDYQGIQLVKRLQRYDDKLKQKAAVLSYFKKFDEAEKIYRDMDRIDLAIELRCSLGDWFRVVQLIQSGGGDDSMLMTAYTNIGHYYYDRQKWMKAVHYYVQSSCYEQLVECYYVIEDFDALERLIDKVVPGAPLLSVIGDKFMSVGLSEQAVNSFLRGNDVKAAIDCCVLLNNWDTAVTLAEQHDFPQIESLLTKYASHLLADGRRMEAVELYRKAGRHADSAKLLGELAAEAGATKVHPLRAKRLYVLAALEVESYRKKNIDAAAASDATGTMKGRTTAATTATLDGLLSQDSGSAVNAKILERAWHGAEAYHFFMMAQRQLYEGNVEAAMKTALRLREYEDILDAADVHALIGMTSFHNKHLGQCSKAFIRLEGLEDATQEKRDAYQDLACDIFTKVHPVDPGTRKFQCHACDQTCLLDWYTECPECDAKLLPCVASGRAITETRHFTCKNCRHRALEGPIRNFRNCPLCHFPIPGAAL